MSWRDKLHLDGKGSFRGVEFYVDKATSRVGRRTIVHLYPGRNQAGVEDNGRSPREFDLECFVVGAEYTIDRDRLRTAFEKEGPGPLVHPYWGNFKVAVRGQVSINETTAEGGMARFTLTVVEVGDALTPVEAQDTVAAVVIAADDSISALQTVINDVMEVAGYIDEVAEAVTNLINDAVLLLNKAKGYVNAVMAVADSIGDAITTLTDTIADLILLPAQLISSVQSIYASIVASITSIGDAWNSYFTDDEESDTIVGTPSTSPTAAAPVDSDARVDLIMGVWRQLDVFGDDTPAVTESTAQREQEADNQAAIILMMRAVAVIETCRAITDVKFGSYDLAISVRDELNDAIDDVVADADPALYGPMMELRASLVAHLNTVSADLPRVVSYVPKATLPALVIAQILYGDAEKDADILSRNSIRDPCRVPGGEVIEVLSDE